MSIGDGVLGIIHHLTTWEFSICKIYFISDMKYCYYICYVHYIYLVFLLFSFTVLQKRYIYIFKLFWCLIKVTVFVQIRTCKCNFFCSAIDLPYVNIHYRNALLDYKLCVLPVFSFTVRIPFYTKSWSFNAEFSVILSKWNTLYSKILV